MDPKYKFSMIKNIRKVANRNLKELKENYFNLKELDEMLLVDFRNYKEIYTNKRLKEMDIEKLRDITEGIPIRVLRDSNLNNVYTLMTFTESSIQAINGIGPISAKKIIMATKLISDSLHSDQSIKIQIDNDSIKLLNSIYKKKSFLKNIDTINQNKKDNERLTSEIEFNLLKSKKISSVLGYLFNKNNAEMMESIKLLEVIDTQKVINEYFSISVLFYIEDVLKDFENNSAEYYSILDLSGLMNTNEHNYLSDTLINDIESQELILDNLKVVPRGYQKFGSRYMIHQKHTLIGDEMGLGKTIEALTVMNHLNNKNKKHFIIVCPLSVLINWEREVKRWTGLRTEVFHGGNRRTAMDVWVRTGGALLTTYQTASVLVEVLKFKIDFLVVDEAHYVKNPGAQRSQSVYKLKNMSKLSTFMTGTPIENNLQEMIHLINVINPNVGSILRKKNYVFGSEMFKKDASPTYLRRNREDVLVELPELEERELWVGFSKKEYDNYLHTLTNGHLMGLRQVAWSGGSRSKSPKLDALMEICEMARDDNRKVIVFSYFKKVLETIEIALNSGTTFGPINGSVSNSNRQIMIDDFSQSGSGSVLLSQIEAGGVGLNIQAASVIILCEPQYKPSTENQAISRAYRMGQSNNVLVYRILTENSIDERIVEILQKKNNIFDQYARDSYISGVSVEAISMSDSEVLKKILQEEKEIHLGQHTRVEKEKVMNY